MSEDLSPYLLVSVSARALACSAARAGQRVLVADLFADMDTRAAASEIRSVAPGQPGLDAESLLAATLALDPGGRAPLVYGSGFDANPTLLAQLSRDRRLLGNTPDTVAGFKTPERLARLLAGLGIPHPAISLQPPRSPAGWLRKRTGGAGGGHVRPARDDDAQAGVYFQRRVPGVPASLTLLSDGRDTRVLGHCRLFCEEQTATRPFLYGGGMTTPEQTLPDGLRLQMEDAATALAAASGLVGLWCMDVMLDDTRWWLIEVNPRPGATFELHERNHSLFTLHAQACLGRLPDVAPRAPGLRAMRVVYAHAPLAVQSVDAWPAWVSDRPAPGTRIEAGEPVCTVHAQGADERDLLALLAQRREQLWQLAGDWREAVA